MTKSVEKTGRTVAEAVRNAAEEMGVSPDDVSVEILDEGKAGLLGILGSRDARVRVTARRAGGRGRVDRAPRETIETRASEADADAAKTIVEEMLDAMGFRFSVEAGVTDGAVEVRIDTVGMDGLLIGQRGTTLASLQHVTSRILARRTGRVVPTVIDVGGYLERRYQLLREKARRMAEEAIRSGKEVGFEPLPARERRVVHMALNEVPGVRTHTVGDGPEKRVVISPSG